MVQLQYLDPVSPFDGVDHNRFIIDEMGMWSESETRHYLMTLKQVRQKWPNAVIPRDKGLYKQPKGKLVRYDKNIDLSWMKPVVWKFTPIGKKTTNLIKKLYGRRIRK